MRKTLMALIAAAALAGAARAQDPMPPDPAIRSVIQSQIDAFLADDFATAFTYASPNIQSLFGTPENFGAMVRGGSPMVWRPDDVRFGALEDRGGVLWQRVIVTDAQGRTHVLGYAMQQVGGAWRIAGVQILPAPDVSA